MKVWYLCINHSGKPGKVAIRETDLVHDLKEKVKEAEKDNPDFPQVSASKLDVWRCTEPELSAEKDVWLMGFVKNIHLSDDKRFVHLSIVTSVKCLELGDTEVLLVQVPGVHAKDIKPTHKPFKNDENCKDCYIRIESPNFSRNDLARNNIIIISETNETSPSLPAHINEYRKERRKIPEDFKHCFHDVLNADTGVLDGPETVDEFSAFESLHMALAALTLKERLPADVTWTETDAISLLFYSFAFSCRYRLGDDDVQVGFGKHQWPLTLPVLLNNEDCQYTPKSDFFLSFHDIPRVIVKVKSEGRDDERIRMLVQGACLVRLVNGQLAKKKKEKDFIVMAFYLDESSKIECYWLYQDKKSSDKVYCLSEQFANVPKSRLQILKQLYNLAAMMGGEKDKLSQLNPRLKEITEFLKEKPALTTRRKRSRPESRANDEESQQRTKRSKGGRAGNDDNDDTLILDGYETVDWTLSRSKPRGLFSVRRLVDGMEFVAKIVEQADERRILQYLGSKDPSGRHVIPLRGIFSSELGPGILLPTRHSVRQLLLNTHKSTRQGRFIHFAEELIEGVAFLHRHGVAHRDIKPDNLVYNDAFELQIIDFDVAVQVEDEYDMVDDEVGTSGYAAPEAYDHGYKTISYSPILADRWSCGANIRDFLIFDNGGDAALREKLSQFANRLMHKEPEGRPSLLEWFEPSHTKRSNCDENPEGQVGPRKKQRLEVNDDSGPHT